MKTNKLTIKFLFLSVLLLLASCSEEQPVLPKGDYVNGILVSGEGSGAGSGSVYFVPNDLSAVQPRIYNKVNKTDLGTFLQSMSFDAKNAYIIVDNQKTITIVDRYTFEKKGVITQGITKPRYMTVVGDKGYVTDWGEGEYNNDNREDDYVAVVNLNNFSVESKISVSAGPERIVEKNGKLYVSHKGGFGTNNVVSVINVANNKVEKEITVNDNPDELVFGSNNNLLVLSSGKAAWTGDETLGAIATINLSNNSVSKIEFPKGVHPSQMVLDNGMVYYSVANDVYKFTESSTVLPQQKIVTVELFKEGYPSFYGMAVKNGKLYALNTSFKDISEIQVFDLSANKKIKSFEAPVGASKIYFN